MQGRCSAFFAIFKTCILFWSALTVYVAWPTKCRLVQSAACRTEHVATGIHAVRSVHGHAWRALSCAIGELSAFSAPAASVAASWATPAGRETATVPQFLFLLSWESLHTASLSLDVRAGALSKHWRTFPQDRSGQSFLGGTCVLGLCQ